MSEADRTREKKVGEEHPAELALTRFLRGELSPSENTAVVRHLLTRCPRCARIMAGLWRLGDPAPGWMTGGGAEPVRLAEVRVDG